MTDHHNHIHIDIEGIPVDPVVDTLTLQSIPVRGTMFTVSALPTTAEGLVICPNIALSSDGTTTDFAGYSVLVHAATGRALTKGDSPELRRIAEKLAVFDWTFTDSDHFSSAANADMRDQVVAIIRAAQLRSDDAETLEIRLMGDSDEMAKARATDPARTLLREHIADWLKLDKARPRYPDDNDEAGIRAWANSIAVSVEEYSVIYLLAVLRKAAPDVADIAARDLFRAWDSGDSFGEWVYQWGDELAKGEPLTLYGIPDAEPLVDENAGGFPT